MKNLVLILLFMFSNLKSQKNESYKFSYKALYEFEFLADSTRENSRTKDIMKLYINDEISIFQSKSKEDYDNYVNNKIKNNDYIFDYMTLPRSKVNFIIFKDLKNKKIEFSEKIENLNVGYIDDVSNYHWKILDEQKTINDYHCQKATLKFRGRNFTAWFTKEIPLIDGPFKFSNLPGLIVSVYDDKNNFSFKLISFEKSDDLEVKYNKIEKLINREDFYPVKLKYLEAMNNRVARGIKQSPIIYNPIELE